MFPEVASMPRKPRKPSSPRYKARMGYEGEYYLVQKFVRRDKPGFYAVRTPGSGSGRMAKPDIIAVDGGELLAIEVKSSGKSYVMLNESQVARLLEFCRRFVIRCPHCGAEIRPKPILAARFLGRQWRFVEIPADWEGSIILRMNAGEASPSSQQPSQTQGSEKASSPSRARKAPRRTG